MADRTTSFAKTVQLESDKEGPLTNYGELTQIFNQESTDQQVDKQQASDQQDHNSEVADAQRHAPAPQYDMRPPPEMARGVDRQNFEERQQQEHERATQELQEYEDYLAAQEEHSNQQSYGDEESDGYGQ